MSGISEEAFASYGQIIPLVTIEDADQAKYLSDALLAAGIQSVEVTLRHPNAMTGVAALAQTPLKVIAGTIVQPVQINQACEAGADLLVSPGATLLDTNAPLIPGVATPTEVMTALAHGYQLLKAFPITALGGEAWLKALAGPLPQAKFMATGGVTPDNAKALLGCENVVAIGASWLATPALMAAKQWQQITDHCRQAQELVCNSAHR